jgi:hypothetical protein
MALWHMKGCTCHTGHKGSLSYKNLNRLALQCTTI